MKTSSTWIIGSTLGKIVMGLALAAMIGSINVLSALGEDNRRYEYDKGRYEHRERGHEHDRGRAHYQTYRPYGYYAPPPVVYTPPPQPGISIFFPIH